MNNKIRHNFFKTSVIGVSALVLSISSVHGAENIKFTSPNINILKPSNLKWSNLNQTATSPQVANLWGDFKKDTPSGFLVKFKDGYKSPLHVNSADYKAIVIDGRFHNGAKNAEAMWMGQGSFWTQPKGEVHETFATFAKEPLAFIEVDSGIYKEQSEDKATNNNAQPINMDASNIIWLDANNANWLDEKASVAGAKVAYFWGTLTKNKYSGTFIKLPPRFKGKLVVFSDDFKAVVARGNPTLTLKNGKKESLELGSFFETKGGAFKQNITSAPSEETILYIRTNGVYRVELE